MKTSDIKTILGKKLTLISAPHPYPHKRPKLNMTYKLAEPYTDNILEEICKKTNIYGITVTNELDFDPNYHKEKRNPYKQEIKNIVKENKIEYFIDIHGLKDTCQYDMAIYYPSKFSKSIQLASYLQKELNRSKLRGINISILRFLDNHQETLGEYVASQLRVPSVQIEIAKYIRENKELRDILISNMSLAISNLKYKN